MTKQFKKSCMGEKTNNFNGLTWNKIIFLSVAFLFLVAGCGGGTAPSSPPVTGKTSKVEKKTVEPTQVTEKAERRELEKKEDFSYTSSGRPDPFRPFFQLTRERRPKGPLSPLQEFELSQLKLVAIVLAPGGNIALVEDSLGKGYFLRKGTVVGKNDGKVNEILKDTVIVEEVYEDLSGRRKVIKVSLSLYGSEKEGQES